MPDSPPAGFESATYTHTGHTACPVAGGDVDVVLFVPVDKSDWQGVFCGSCQQQLVTP